MIYVKKFDKLFIILMEFANKMKLTIINNFKPKYNETNYKLLLNMIFNIYNLHNKDLIILHNPIIINKCRDIFLNKNTFLPNKYYKNLLQYIIKNMPYDSEYTAFLITFLMVLEENAITGIIKLDDIELCNSYVVNLLKI
jgi:hypothetical protein